jgi:flagellar hook-associated protein 2
VGKGIIQLKVGDGSTTDIAVSATDTIDDVAQAINDAKAGVKATVIFDGTNYFLTLSGEDTGSANKISLIVTDEDGFNKDASNLSRLFYEDLDPENQMVQAQAAADSIITIDVSGLTITLESAPAVPDNEAALTVSRNTLEIVSKINSFVSAYNNVLDFFDASQSYSQDTETAGLLMGDATTNSIRNSLRNMVTNTVPGVESFERLTDFGITMNSEGRLEVDSSTINSALDDDFDDVVEFFTQATEGSEGFAVRMVDTLDVMLDSTNGALDARTDGIQNSIDDIQDQVERIEMRNLAWETRTRAQFNALELLLAGYQNTGNYLSQQITGMQNFNNYISNRG